MGQQTAQHGNQQQKISGHVHLSFQNSGVPQKKRSGSAAGVPSDWSSSLAAQQRSSHSAGHRPPGQPENFYLVNNLFK
jgi:hypothetical protein